MEDVVPLTEPPPGRRSRRWGRALFLGLFGAGLLAACWSVYYRERDLKDISIALGEIPNRVESGEDTLTWVTDSRLIYVVQDPQSMGKVMERDFSTGEEHELPGLTKAWSLASGPTNLYAAPNGRHLLWSSLGDYLAATDASGDEYSIWPGTREDGGYCWDVDSSRVVGLVRDSHGRPSALGVRRVSDPVGGENLAIDGATQSYFESKLQALSISQSITGAVVREGVLYLASIPQTLTRVAPEAHIFAKEVRAESPPCRNIVVPMPEGTNAAWARFSPDGRRIVWVFRRTRPNRVAELIQRFWKSYKVDVHRSSELWVSNVDGSEMREIGYIASLVTAPELTHVRWMPSCRQIAFFVDDSLYVVGVR